jgi:hypothetical protein
MSDLQQRLETGPWKWEIYEALPPWSVLAAGEAETYEAIHAAMVLTGIKRVKEGKRYLWNFEGRKVFIRCERLADGFTMNDWGTVVEE